MSARGAAKAANSFKAAEEGDRIADTSYGKALTRQFLPGLVEWIEEYCAPGGATRFGKYRKLVRMVDADKAALLTLRGVFQDPFSERQLPALAKLIGGMVEDEAKFTVFQDDHEEYYDAIIQDFKQKNTSSYRHRRRVLTFKMNEREVSWQDWSADDKLHVGMILLDCVLKSSDLIEKSTKRIGPKTQTVVTLTASAAEWIEKHKDHMSLLSPEFMPTIIEPDPWTALDIGGYYSPKLRRRAPLVKTRSSEHRELLRSADLTNTMAMVNSLQSTPWRVNRRVHDVVREIWKKGLRIGMGSPDPIEIPPSPVAKIDKANFTQEDQDRFDEWRREAARLHTLENERVKKNFQAVRLMRTAENYREYDQFWYVYQLDFRGRVYPATAGLSPQGPDMGKALIEFAEAKPLGDRGFYWLKVHFSNLLGHDKVDYDDRAEYTDSLRDGILAVADDPLGKARHIWVNADKPFCALATAFELADAYTHGPDNVDNRIAVALDGSCNGLQHYAAMLRDRVGAEATNVTFTGGVADIYSKVGCVAADRLRGHKPKDEVKEVHGLWIEYLDGGGLPRKLSKKPVMTLPYGATQRSCTDSILDFLSELNDERFPPGSRMRSSTYMTTHLWAGIGDVVTSARTAMSWVQSTASVMAKKGEPLIWETVLGFPVYQGTPKIRKRRIRTHLGGDIHMQIGEFTDELNPVKQSSGSAPNFVHSQDATHLNLVILLGIEVAITSIAAVHDSIGTYARDIDELHRIIRQAFVDLYADTNALRDFWEQQVARTGLTDLPPPPEQGDFDVREVMDSPFFFG